MGASTDYDALIIWPPQSPPLSPVSGTPSPFSLLTPPCSPRTSSSLPSFSNVRSPFPPLSPLSLPTPGVIGKSYRPIVPVPSTSALSPVSQASSFPPTDLSSPILHLASAEKSKPPSPRQNTITKKAAETLKKEKTVIEQKTSNEYKQQKFRDELMARLEALKLSDEDEDSGTMGEANNQSPHRPNSVSPKEKDTN